MEISISTTRSCQHSFNLQRRMIKKFLRCTSHCSIRLIFISIIILPCQFPCQHFQFRPRINYKISRILHLTVQHLPRPLTGWWNSWLIAFFMRDGGPRVGVLSFVRMRNARSTVANLLKCQPRAGPWSTITFVRYVQKETNWSWSHAVVFNF